MSLNNNTPINEISLVRIEKNDQDTGWEEVKRRCANLSDWGLHILKKGLGNSVLTVLIEPYYMCKDFRNLYSHYFSKKFVESSPNTNRLHFFSSNIDSTSELLLNSDKFQNDYIGFSVIRPLKDKCLGRTVLDLKKIDPAKGRGYYYLETEFTVHILGQKYTVKGYPYTAQTTDVNVCAHSALWGVCRFLSERYPVYKELYPFDFVELSDTSQGRTFPYRGMTYADYAKILSDFGTFPVILRIKSNNEYSTERFQDIYTYVESGFPVLASYTGHVVALIGHTIDYNAAITPDEEGFVDSSQFLKQYVVIDDNCFPYQLLGNKEDPENYTNAFEKSYTLSDIATAVCPLPEKIFLQADKARKVAARYVKKYKEEIQQKGTGPFVLRLFITTNSSFKKRKIDFYKKANNDQLLFKVISIRLPHFVWVLEISPIEKYKKNKCSTEFVIDSTAASSEKSLIYARIGDTLYLRNDNNYMEMKFRGNPILFSQYTHNLGERDE